MELAKNKREVRIWEWKISQNNLKQYIFKSLGKRIVTIICFCNDKSLFILNVICFSLAVQFSLNHTIDIFYVQLFMKYIILLTERSCQI